MLCNISQSKGNQIIIFGVDYNKKTIFHQKSCRKQAGRLVSYLFLFFKKASKQVVVQLVLIYFTRLELGIQQN